MPTPVHVSTSSHIGEHRIVEELGLVRVNAADVKPGVATKSPLWRLLNYFAFGALDARFRSYDEAVEYLKDAVRTRGGNGVIQIRCEPPEYIERIEGVAVKIEPKGADRTERSP